MITNWAVDDILKLQHTMIVLELLVIALAKEFWTSSRTL